MKSALRGGFVGPKMKDGLHRQIEIVWGYPALSAPVPCMHFWLQHFQKFTGF